MCIESIVSSIVGGIFVLIGVLFASFIQSKKEKNERKRIVENFLSAIANELSVLLDIYSNSIGKELENLPDNKPFLNYYLAGESYFSIYENNASLIPEVKLEEVRSHIITIYNKAKSLLDSYKMNNYLIKQLEISKLNFKASGDTQFQQTEKFYIEQLIQYAAHLKGAHFTLISNIYQLLESIKKYS